MEGHAKGILSNALTGNFEEDISLLHSHSLSLSLSRSHSLSHSLSHPRRRVMEGHAKGVLHCPVTCNPSRAVTLPNIGVPHYIGVPHRVTFL